MAYTAITSAEIQVDKFVKQSLMQKIKDNFDYLFGSSSGGSSSDGILNASFDIDSDSDGDPDNWTVADYSGGAHALDATNAAHGAYALKFTHPGGAGNGGGYADTAYLPCSNLTSFIVKLTNKCSQSGVKNQVVVRYFTEALVDLSADEVIYSETSNPIVLTAITTGAANPPATAQYMKIRIVGGYTDTDPGSSTDIWFDDVSIIEKGFFVASATGYIVGALAGEVTYSAASMIKVAEGVVTAPGTLYSSFFAGVVTTSSPAGGDAQVYINGSAVGTSHSVDETRAEFTDASITVDRGDLIQLYAGGLAGGVDVMTLSSWVLRSSYGDELTFGIQARL